MNSWFDFGTWGGLPVLVEVFWKSGVVLGVALCASGLLRKCSADLRRIVLSASVVGMLIAAVLAPAVPHWTATPPVWFALPASKSVAAVERRPGPVAESPVSNPPRQDVASHRVPIRASWTGIWDRVANRVSVVLLVWSLGAAILLVRLLIGLNQLRRLRIDSRVWIDDALLTRLGSNDRVLLLENETVDTPVTWGIVRPVILVPAFFRHLPVDQRMQVLCHELGHIQARDFALRTLVEVVRAIIWFQPLIWIVRRKLREEQELACDNRVVAAGGKPSAYARLLMQWDCGAERNTLIAVGMAQRNCLIRRLYALLNADAKRESASRAAKGVTWFIGLTAALPLAAFSLVSRSATVHQITTVIKPAVVESQPLAPPRNVPQAVVARSEPVNEQVPPLAPPVQAQSAQPVAFEVASIKPFPEGTPLNWSGCQGGPGSTDPGEINCQYVTLKFLLMQGYSVKNQEILGPGWIDSTHYNVLAKVPPGTTKEQLREMYRNLLAERFEVALHHESRKMTAYALTLAKGGSKLKEHDTAADSNPDDTPAADGKLPIGGDGFQVLRRSSLSGGLITLFRNGRAKMQGNNVKIANLADALSRQLDQSITDETGLAGSYDVSLIWTPDPLQMGGRPASDAASGASDPQTSLFGAVEQQLGLKLVPKKVARDCLVIDHAEKIPTGN